MSLFRPDLGMEPPRFVAGGFGSGVERSRAVAESSFATSVLDSDESGREIREADRVIEEEVVEPIFDAATVSELEQAAFDRGAESARGDTERLLRACEAIEGVATQWKSVTRGALRANRELMLSLAAQIAGRWVGAELSEAPESLVRMLDQALEILPSDEAVRISLSRPDLDRLTAELPDRVASWCARDTVELFGRDDLSRGEYRLDSASASLDGRVDSVLSHVREVLEGVLESAPAEVVE